MPRLKDLIAGLARTGRREPKKPVPHFVADYHAMVRELTSQLGHEEAMRAGVGGSFEAVGRGEVELLRYLGLADGQMVMDVGCGSGRLAIPLAKAFAVTYHGSDIVPEFLDHARRQAPASYRFTLVDGLTIPERDDSADIVTFFSVATHLMHHETYLYLEEARRVAKPGGRIVVSFLDFDVEAHWQPFADLVAATRRGDRMHLNAFIAPSMFAVWARRLGLEIELRLPRGEFVPHAAASGERPAPVRLGQSVVVLRKPVGE
jgi:SAM-dependent methyltransferase